MRILWDLRLFSLGYSTKGVGQYCKSLCVDFLNNNHEHEIYLLGDEKKIPNEITSKSQNIITYNIKSWKYDLIHLPKIVKKQKIDIFHSWIALGPIHQIGNGFNMPCKTISTVHDLAVEQWLELDYLKSTKKSWYWKIQKHLIKQDNHLLFNSHDTQNNFFKIIKKKINNAVLYPKIELNTKSKCTENFLIALGGSESKNLQKTIEAFSCFNNEFKDFSLIIPGNCDEILKDKISNSNIKFLSFNEYEEQLSKSTALLAFSLHEGLGIPPIEAMSLGIPAAVSDIPPFKETLKDSAVYANPNDLDEMISAITKITLNREFYLDKTKERYKGYQELTKNNGDKLLNIYETLLNK